MLNSWEAAYFDFDGEKILQIAREAAGLGVELFVLDDGWFEKAENEAGLGDWTVNRDKLKMDLKDMSDRIHEMGMQFGIWVEPEMVSEDSDLYRRHPDWCLRDPGRPAVRGRYQLVLDLSRRDVCDYLIGTLNGIVEQAKIEYVKMGGTHRRGPVRASRQKAPGGGSHRYMLGLYYM